MRKWSVAELERIESDMELIRSILKQDHAMGIGTGHMMDCPADCKWLADRIEIREKHATHAIERCDGCPDEAKIPVMVIVDEMWDEMGAPTNLSYTYLCRYHLRNYY